MIGLLQIIIGMVRYVALPIFLIISIIHLSQLGVKNA